MQDITIESFGPIKTVNISVSDITILNGRQSAGKSTIAKTIYFFRSAPETVFRSLAASEDPAQETNKEVVTVLRKHLMDIFGTTKHMADFRLEFTYAAGKVVTVTRENQSGHARIKLSDHLRNGVIAIAQRLQAFHDDSRSHENSRDFATIQAERFRFLNQIKREIYLLFEESRTPVFIPAGRSLVTTLSGELKDIDSWHMDGLIKDFVQRIYHQRSTFSKSLDELVEDRKRLSAAKIDFQRVKKATELIKRIIQGQYRYSRHGEEQLFIDDETYVWKR